MELRRDTPYDSLPDLLTADEFARLVGLSRWAVYELIKRGELQCRRYGKKTIRIPKGALHSPKGDDHER